MNSFMLSSSIFLLAFIIIYPLIGMAKKFEQEHFSEDECRNAGFSNSLKCSACELLLNFGLEEILSDCLQCCSKEVKEIEHDV
jgi:hypothetical protein